MKYLLFLFIAFSSLSVSAQSFFNFFKKENQNLESSKIYTVLWNEVSKIKDYPEENQLAVMAKSETDLEHFINEKKVECSKVKDKANCHRELLEAVDSVIEKLTDVKRDFLIRSHKKDLEVLERAKSDYNSKLQATLQTNSR
jgi:hypothetical protein